MFKIAVCDDAATERGIIQSLLRQFSEQNHIFLSVDLYASSLDLLDAVQNNTPYDIYLLDIFMPGLDGIDLARELHAQDPGGLIIYLTSSQKHALEAFHVFAFQYLLKPPDKALLFQALERAINHVVKQKANILPVKTKDGVVFIPFSSLIFAELENHTVRFHISGGEEVRSIYLRTSFEKIVQPLLDDARFIRPHQSYVANLYWIKKIQPQSILMEDGSILPVTRGAAAEIKKKYTSSTSN